MYVYALEAFQMPIEMSFNFSKANGVSIPLFKSCESIPLYSSTNRKKYMENSQRNSANRKRNQSADTFLGFEKSNKIQKLDEYPA